MSDIRDTFLERLANDKQIQSLLNKKDKRYLDADDYAIRVGEILGDALSDDDLGDLENVMDADHQSVADYTKDVQTSLNHASNLNIKGLRVSADRDRIDGLVTYAIKNAIDEHLKEFIINYNQNVVTSTMKRNAEFQSEAGLQPKIIRRLHGPGCEYCREYAGEYEYPDDVPDDVYRRHANCRCTVDYYPGDGRKQDVWTKEYSETHAEEIAERIRISKQ